MHATRYDGVVEYALAAGSRRKGPHVVGVVVKSSESRDEILEVRTSPLQHAQEMDRGVRVVLADVLRQLLNPAKAPRVDKTTRSKAAGRLQTFPLLRTAEQLSLGGMHLRARQPSGGLHLTVNAVTFGVPVLHIYWNIEKSPVYDMWKNL